MNLQDVLPRFLEEPGGHVVCDTDFRVVAAGPEYLRLTRSSRERLIGKLLFNTLTEPDPERHARVEHVLRTAMGQALKTGETVKLDVMRADVMGTADGAATEKWWRCALIPVKDEQGLVQYVVLRLEDVTVECVVLGKLRAQRRSNYILYLLVVLLVGISFFVLTQVVHDNRGRINQHDQLLHEVCTQVQAINNRLHTTIKRQLDNVGKPGTAGYSYYVAHPLELRSVLSEGKQELQTFTPKKCS